MAYPASPALPLNDRQRILLENYRSKATIPLRDFKRVSIILNGANGLPNTVSAKKIPVDLSTVEAWRSRWLMAYPELLIYEQGTNGKVPTDSKLLSRMLAILQDAPRPGHGKTITEEQEQLIVALSCKKPEEYGHKVKVWSQELLAKVAIQEGIVATISDSTVRRILKKKELRPDRSEYWLFPRIENWDDFVLSVNILCATIKQAIQPGATFRLISCDEKTGMQALERHQEQASRSQGGHLRQEFEYIRHGTTCLCAGVDVATGLITGYTLQPTRTETDLLAFVEDQVSKLEAEEQVVFLFDQLNTHKSASLVKWVAGQIGYKEDLGKKGKSGILKSLKTRMTFLEEKSHSIRFLFTPKHCSWLNPIENWFARLSRYCLKNASFTSVDNLIKEVDEFITYHNGCMAKPFNWKFDGFSKDRPIAHCLR